jgi:hypothetical protein
MAVIENNAEEKSLRWYCPQTAGILRGQREATARSPW